MRRVDFTTVSDGVESIVAALNSFRLASGPKLQTFLSKVPSESKISQHLYYKEQKVSDSTAQHQTFSTNMMEFLHKLIMNNL